MKTKTIKENGLTIYNVPDDNSFFIALNLAIMKADMLENGIKEAEYRDMKIINK